MRPMKVHGPLDMPAVQHNQECELEAVRVLLSPLSGPSARHDAEAVLVALGWPELAIRLAKGEKVGPVPSEQDALFEPGIRAHIQKLHPKLDTGRKSDLRLSDVHSRDHWRNGSRTHHHGPNPGPNARPRGWRTGGGVVLL